MFRSRTLFSASLASAVACSAAAVPVTLVNPSFEAENIGFITSSNASPQPVPGFDIEFLSGGGFYGTDNSRASDSAVDGANDFYFKNIALTTDAGRSPRRDRWRRVLAALQCPHRRGGAGHHRSS